MNYNIITMNNRGFTLIELVIVVGIIGVLTSSLIGYSRSAERQIILFKDQAKIMEALLRAKSLTISTYSETDAPCGFGVSFNQSDKKTFVIFKDLSVNPNCSDADNIYSGTYMCGAGDFECMEKFTLDEKIIEFSNLTLQNIVYIPPNPQVIIDNDDMKNSAQIEIKTFDGTAKKIITVTNNGQITIQ